MPKYEDGFRYSVHNALGYNEDGSKDYSSYYLVIVIIPFFIFVLWTLLIYSIYLLIIILIIIIILSIAVIYYMIGFKTNLLIEAIAYEKKSGRSIVPDAYRPNLIEFENKHFKEIQERIKVLDLSDFVLHSPKPG